MHYHTTEYSANIAHRVSIKSHICTNNILPPNSVHIDELQGLLSGLLISVRYMTRKKKGITTREFEEEQEEEKTKEMGWCTSA